MKNKAVVQTIRSISPVWIVPVVALMIAIWLAVQARLEKGTVIQISFAQASDIIPGQTLIKLKNVKVGVVKSVRLSADLKTVLVKAEVDRGVSDYLSNNTRFWVVTPRISATGVSNLGTLISGVYIVMDPGEKGSATTKFEGLSEPPAFESDEPGAPFVLQAQELGALDIGSPIYYRQIRVGEVTGYELARDSDYVDINIFIRAPHHNLVRTRSRFWNVSGFGVNIGPEGMKAKMTSLAALINGGITFENVVGFESNEPAQSGQRFYLHPDRESVLDGEYSIEYYYLLKFSGSVRGLHVGAPVEFRGIKIGEVVDIELDNSGNLQHSLKVYISMEPQRLYPQTNPTREEVDSEIEKMVQAGLRAQMKTGSLITGARFIDMAFVEKVNPKQNLIRAEKYSEIPTTEDAADLIAKQFSDVLAKVNKIPLDDIGRDLAGSLASLNKILGTLEKANTAQSLDGAVKNMEQTLLEANKTLNEMAQAMKSLDQAVAPDSEVRYELTETLKSVNQAAKSFEQLMNQLNRNPDALIKGVENDE